MTYSLGETRYLSKYAARGAGMSWGMADEAADAVVWLQRFGLPGAQLLVELLALNDLQPACDFAPESLEGDWSAKSGRLCPLATGAALSDCAWLLHSGEMVRILDITHPLLVVPFAASAALSIGADVMLEWQDVCVVVGGNSLDVSGSTDNLQVSCMSEIRCVRHDVQAALPAPGGRVRHVPSELRVPLDEACRLRLSTFAQRTYAPATDDSRKLGAGAGLADND